MKKLFAIVIALLFVNVVSAQHFNQVTQSGNLNVSTIEQEFTVPGNNILPGNIAYVDQVGPENFSNIYQMNFGYGNNSDPNSRQYADVDQNGYSNESWVDQQHQGHTLAVDQDGNNNFSDVQQWGNINWGWVRQLGNSNVAIITDQSTRAYQWIQQYGNSNTGIQTLTDMTEDDYQTIYQEHDGNYALQFVEGAGYGQAILNRSEITQVGYSNEGYQRMEWDDITFGNSHNTAFLRTVGNDNLSIQYMKRSNNTSIVNQTGNLNTSLSYQNW